MWSYCSVTQSPTKMRKAQAEVDSVLSNGAITVESLKKLEYVTCTIIFYSSRIDSFIFHLLRDRCMVLNNKDYCFIKNLSDY